MATLAISPCPNDTFAFYGLISEKTSWREPLELTFADIEELNQLCFDGNVHYCKISFGAYPFLCDRYQLLEAGSALGRGCGPLVVATRQMPLAALRGKTIAVPGKFTTATLLLKLLLGDDLNLEIMSFEKIMPAVAEGDVDAGLIIHESRFTFERHGLVNLIDLGDWWEQETGHLIPLGGIVAHRDLPEEEIQAFDRALVESIDFAWNNQHRVVPFMQRHAQEMEPDVMRRHVDLYVNDYTRCLGENGRAAVDFLVAEARRKCLV